MPPAGTALTWAVLSAASAIKWSSVIVTMLLCAAYAAIGLLEPATTYSSATEAFMAAQQPFESSPSALMSKAGPFASLADGLAAYGMSEAAGMAFPPYVVCRIALVAGAFFSVANLLGACSLERVELRRMFAPLGTPGEHGARGRVVGKYVAADAVLPVCLCAAFLGADLAVDQASETEEFTAEGSFVAEQFQSQIEQGIDDSQLEAEFDSFVEQASQLKAGIEQELAGCELSGVPEWLVTTKELLADDFLSLPLEPTEKPMDAGARLGISTGVGAGGGYLVKKLVEKAMGKEFSKKLISKLSSMGFSRAASAFAGGALGTIGGPAGTVAGIAAGTAINVGVDSALLEIDEMQNRETYKQEIIATIEEERAEKLALVG